MVPTTQKSISWSNCEWLNKPSEFQINVDNSLTLVSENCTDFWRTTSYGFIHDNGHALLTDFPQDTSFEVTFQSTLTDEFDQAGLLIRTDERNWIKAGVEYSDGLPQLGAVVTRGSSDWSVSPSPDWNSIPITIRASRCADAITIRAKTTLQDYWQLVRVAPYKQDAQAKIGPYTCSPTRAGLVVQFTRFAMGPKDKSLHS